MPQGFKNAQIIAEVRAVEERLNERAKSFETRVIEEFERTFEVQLLIRRDNQRAAKCLDTLIERTAPVSKPVMKPTRRRKK